MEGLEMLMRAAWWINLTALEEIKRGIWTVNIISID